MANKAVRAWSAKNMKNLSKMEKKFHLKVLQNLHLDPNHKALILFEARKAEDVRDFIAEAGFMHFCENEFYFVTPVEALLKKADSIPTIY